jgi:peptidoglycan/xylan/chitin deacetylase (PgdA/CDA1 family)
MRGSGRLKSWVRRASSGFSPRVAILMYHRVFAPESDPLMLCVSPTHFAEHVEYLKRTYPVLRLSDLLNGRQLPMRAAVITFDDGYADNVSCALPILQDAQVPATVFITSAQVESGQEFWWDELQTLVRSASDFAELHAQLREMDTDQRERTMHELRDAAGTRGEPRRDYRPLTWEEVRVLAQSGVVEVGAHTDSHPVLARLSAERQRAEIHASKRQLEAHTGRQITTFAYPYGGPTDFNQCSQKLVLAAGFRLACTTIRAPVTRFTQPTALPRLTVRDWAPDLLAQRLDRFFRE